MKASYMKRTNMLSLVLGGRVFIVSASEIKRLQHSSIVTTRADGFKTRPKELEAHIYRQTEMVLHKRLHCESSTLLEPAQFELSETKWQSGGD